MKRTRRPWASAFIVQSVARRASNYRSEEELDRYLSRYDIPGIAGLDTRALTRHLRTRGTMNGMITSREDLSIQACSKIARDYRVTGVVKMVSRTEMEHIPGEGKRVALMDYGAKNSILRSLRRRGCDLYVFPYNTPAEEVLAIQPDGIMLSNGPGDPEECVESIACVRKLYDSGLPIFGICLGHQITALAMGAKTVKMDYGHHGGNHPVKDVEKNVVMITAQNHGFAVDEATLPANLRVTHKSLFDGTLQGIHRTDKPAFSFQGHPEASPGPHDAAPLFDHFIALIEQYRKTAK